MTDPENGLTTEEQDYELAWQDDANCLGVDSEIFFPAKGEDPTPAKMICAKCVVKEECLEFALRHRDEGGRGKFGIWGGMTEKGRRKELRRRQRAARRAS